MSTAIPREVSEPMWIFFVLLLAFGLLAWLNYAYSKKLRTQLDGFFTNRHVGQILREEGPSSQLPVGVLLGIGVIAYSMFAYLTIELWEIYEPEMKSSLFYSALCGGIIVVFLIKTGVTRLMSFIIGEDYGVREHIYNMFLFSEVSGVFLLPVVVGMAYMPEKYGYWAFFIGVVIIALTYVYRVLRGLIIGINHKVSVFYLILYLCTLEILPLVVVIKLFSGEN